MSAQTQFFCRCGRLLTAETSARSTRCPACQTVSVVPGGDPAPPVPGTEVLQRAAGSFIGRYRVERVLGRGGMGVVYRAVDVRTQQPAALKLLHAHFQDRPDFVTRFQREARAAARLRHPNIVRILDSGLEGSVPYLAMELLEGSDLLALTRSGPIEEELALRLLQQVAAGLEAAATLGITHRDIKPTNLVLQADGVVKIADFGLAKATDSDSHLTVTGEVLGTPHYMSPEQGRGAPVDFRSDLYSLGATFYHLLTGKPPFDADTPVGVILRHLNEEPEPLRSRQPRVSAGLEAVIHRLMQKNPKQRYKDYPTLRADLQRVAAGGTPEHGARPPARKVRQGETTYLLPADRATQVLLHPSGAVRRLLGFVLDLTAVQCFLLLVLWGCAWLDLGPRPPTMPFLTRMDLFEGRLGLVLAGVSLLATLCYFAAGDSNGGRTFGKKRMRLRVCRRDGRDLGPVRGTLRTLLLLPGIVAVTPLPRDALRTALAEFLPGTLNLDGARVQSAGLAWLGLLWFVGKFALNGRPLQDTLVDAEVYRARPAELTALRRRQRRVPVPVRAAWLSVLPGVGLMYAGRPGLGLLFLPAIPIGVEAFPPVGVGLWVLSALLAHEHAARRHREASRPPEALDPGLLRRQES